VNWTLPLSTLQLVVRKTVSFLNVLFFPPFSLLRSERSLVEFAKIAKKIVFRVFLLLLLFFFFFLGLEKRAN
jgi:hypothetical protein